MQNWILYYFEFTQLNELWIQTEYAFDTFALHLI